MPIKPSPVTNRLAHVHYRQSQATNTSCSVWHNSVSTTLTCSLPPTAQARRVWKDCVINLVSYKSWLVLSTRLNNSTARGSIDLTVWLLQFFTKYKASTNSFQLYLLWKLLKLDQGLLKSPIKSLWKNLSEISIRRVVDNCLPENCTEFCLSTAKDQEVISQKAKPSGASGFFRIIKITRLLRVPKEFIAWRDEHVVRPNGEREWQWIWFTEYESCTNAVGRLSNLIYTVNIILRVKVQPCDSVHESYRYIQQQRVLANRDLCLE